MALTKVTYSMIKGASVSVVDFNADPTGVVDSTNAINNAAAKASSEGMSLYIPSGVYLVSGALNISGFVYGDGTEQKIVSSDWYGSTQYNTSSMWGSGSIIVWDKSSLTTTDTYINPISSGDSLFLSNLTFISKSDSGNGGGILVTRRDASASDSFINLGINYVNIGNFATGVNLEACSEGNYVGIQFRGCRTAISASGSAASPSSVVTYTTFSASQIEGCGSQNSTYPCVNLARTQNIGFRDCVFQGTSDIRLTTALGTTTFDHCWMEAQSATDNLLLKAVVGGTIQAIVFQNCYAGAGSIGDVDFSANLTGGDLILLNSKMSGMNVIMNGSNQYLLMLADSDVGTRTNVIYNRITTSGGFNYQLGNINTDDGQLTITSSEASTKQLALASSTTSPKVRAGMQSGGAGNGFITSNYYFQAGNQTDDAGKGLVSILLNSTASSPTIGFGVSVAGSASPTTRTLISPTAYYPNQDNAMKLGDASNRWSEVYAAVGTINTSDKRSKQDISELNDAEKRVALAIKGLIKKFKFKDAVAKKGFTARIHVGVIAQEVKAAFETEGLDADKYGIFCYDEWAEIPEIKTEDGYVIQEYRPAGNIYGVRYEELLAFIIAAI